MSKFNLSQILKLNLLKYNIVSNNYNKMKINTIIFNKKIHYVSKFKEFLIWNDCSEFLPAYYPMNLTSLYFEELIQYQSYVKYPCFVNRSINNIMKIYKKKRENLMKNNFNEKYKLKLEFSNILNSIDKTQSFISNKANKGSFSETTIDNIGVNDDITVSLDLKINKKYDYKEIEKEIDFVKEKNYKNDKIIENLMTLMKENKNIDRKYQTIKNSGIQRNKKNGRDKKNNTLKLTMDDYKKISKITYKNQKKNIMTTKNSRIKHRKIEETSINKQHSQSLKIKENNEINNKKKQLNHKEETLSKNRRTRSIVQIIELEKKSSMKKIPLCVSQSRQRIVDNNNNIIINNYKNLFLNKEKKQTNKTRTKTEINNNFYMIKIYDNNSNKNITLKSEKSNKFLKVSKSQNRKLMKMSNKSLNSIMTNGSITNFQTPKNIKMNNNVTNPSFSNNENEEVVYIKKNLFNEGKKSFNKNNNSSYRFSKSKDKNKNNSKSKLNSKSENWIEKFSSTRTKKNQQITKKKNNLNHKREKKIYINLTTGRKNFANFNLKKFEESDFSEKSKSNI